MTQIGSLGAPYLDEILVSLHGERASVDLRLTRADEIGFIAVRRGELVHATIVRRRDDRAPCAGGTLAVYEMLAWSTGTFSIVRTQVPIETTIRTALNDLLLEGTRRLADGADIRRRLPPRDVVLEVVRTPRGVMTTPLSPVELTTLAAIDGGRTLGDVLARSVLGVALCGQAVLRLLSVGLVAVRRPRDDATCTARGADSRATYTSAIATRSSTLETIARIRREFDVWRTR
ncbi:MAG: hypothetical protein NVS2B3_13800 [Vulcanimicrobiaceae bacterium]